jgi:5-oxoprolinase (ATP-hydrolysing) subunit A
VASQILDIAGQAIMSGSPLHPRSIDLNADLGEGFPNDRALLELVTSASICCGAHAGSDDVIRQTLSAAKISGVVVGAHPGYADREGFGRRDQHLRFGELHDLIVGQVDHLRSIAATLDLEVAFIKPHGALYNQAQRDSDLATAVVVAAALGLLPLVGLPGSLLEVEARRCQWPYVAEGFPDRRYRDDGSLVPRSEPDAILHDPAEIEAQVLRLVNERRVATLCIHGDDPRAVANAELVRRVLSEHAISIRSFLEEPT